MRHTIWYTDMFVSLIIAERHLYQAVLTAKEGDGVGSDSYGNLRMQHASLSEQVDDLVEESKKFDFYPLAELESVEFIKPTILGFDECEISECRKQATVNNHFIRVCKKHSQGNRPQFYSTKSATEVIQ